MIGGEGIKEKETAVFANTVVFTKTWDTLLSQFLSPNFQLSFLLLTFR